MFEPFFRTDQDLTRFIQRIVLGLVMLPHGLQKLLGWFGGAGFEASVSFFASMGVPPLLAMLVIAGETVGAVALILGLATRLAAFGTVCTMFGAMATVHLSNGFFMNWYGNQSGEGYEYHLLALALAIPLMLFGGGKWALDHTLTRKLEVEDAKPKVVD